MFTTPNRSVVYFNGHNLDINLPIVNSKLDEKLLKFEGVALTKDKGGGGK